VSLFGLFERRASVEDPAVPLTSPTLLELLGGAPTEAGVPVTPTGSLAMPAVWRCVALISSVSASLPLHTYRGRDRERTENRLLADPHPELTPYDLWRITYVHRCLWGNAYLQKVRHVGSGQVVELWPIRPERVRVGRVSPAEVPGGKVFEVTDDEGRTHVLTSADVLHLPGLGYDGITGVSPIRAAQQGIGMGLAAEQAAARFFGSGNMLGGILQTEQRLTAEQAEALKARWQAKVGGVGHAHEIAVLDSGASFQPIGVPNRDAQFLESRQFQVIEIARMFGVPPFLLMETDKATSWGTGLEQQALGFVQFDLHPTWLRPTEQRVTKGLLPRGTYAEYAVEGLLRGDSRSRAEFYRAMRELGVYSANDIRRLENLPPIPGGDTYIQPLNMGPLGAAGQDSEGGDADRTQ